MTCRRDIQSVKRRRQGFTLVEMLVTVLLLLLLTGLMTTGMNLAVTQQRQSVFYSQTSALQSTIDNALSDPLRYMEQVTAEGSDAKWKLVYRDDQANYILDADPKLMVGTGKPADSYDASGTMTSVNLEKGHLYLCGDSPSGKGKTYIKLLNAGAYGGTGGGNYNADVYVQLVDADGNKLVDASGNESTSLAPVAVNEDAGATTGTITIHFRLVSSVDSSMQSDVYTLTYRVSSFAKKDDVLYESA